MSAGGRQVSDLHVAQDGLW